MLLGEVGLLGGARGAASSRGSEEEPNHPGLLPQLLLFCPSFLKNVKNLFLVVLGRFLQCCSKDFLFKSWFGIKTV
jgi:hypothetical protein